ncbi:uncharacterized protein TRIADDRAFT_61623 [Trichoplax adhaerens]|uniref:Uncharacterized protein n=1 Tax=Trichoplax adhaerens TaxID=10228 RepID=B3SBH9_TRIAD|nr:predicted protein [Trichoplax adhaerens]EDV19855.1 predicted protein [Trichoplax adhaerens]|eukprot:XP_002117597.1 predicted protein [Trichoplax adhaerens]
MTSVLQERNATLLSREEIRRTSRVVNIISIFILGIASIVLGIIGNVTANKDSDICILYTTKIQLNIWIGVLEILYILSVIILFSASLFQSIISLFALSLFRKEICQFKYSFWYYIIETYVSGLCLLIALRQLGFILYQIYPKLGNDAINQDDASTNSEFLPGYQSINYSTNAYSQVLMPKWLRYTSTILRICILFIGSIFIIIGSVAKNCKDQDLQENELYIICAASLIVNLHWKCPKFLTIISFGFTTIISALSMLQLFIYSVFSMIYDGSNASYMHTYVTCGLSIGCFIISSALVVITFRGFKNLAPFESVNQALRH